MVRVRTAFESGFSLLLHGKYVGVELGMGTGLV